MKTVDRDVGDVVGGSAHSLAHSCRRRLKRDRVDRAVPVDHPRERPALVNPVEDQRRGQTAGQRHQRGAVHGRKHPQAVGGRTHRVGGCNCPAQRPSSAGNLGFLGLAGPPRRQQVGKGARAQSFGRGQRLGRAIAPDQQLDVGSVGV